MSWECDRKASNAPFRVFGPALKTDAGRVETHDRYVHRLEFRRMSRVPWNLGDGRVLVSGHMLIVVGWCDRLTGGLGDLGVERLAQGGQVKVPVDTA